ncbi:hypothetical protein [Enterobacter kobei]|uniref:hypothetical protein n=1 Tax=Enterobacter kobei TaxID=208224 RepID=UPI003B42997C
MFEISEDTICDLMSLLTCAAPKLPQPAVPDMATVETTYPDVQTNWQDAKMYAEGWNACRAAMLQAEPVSNSDELPLDYLQGHKDGLEWAAQLAEANHPQTGDWLYDDPIDLARAISKGPDMPTAQAGNHTEQHLDMVDHSGDANKMVAGNSPVIPDCSCRTCRPVTFSDSRFVVCPECGNKRCPHANDHRNACSGSNEPGQEGSAYPAAPQQEVK